MLRADVPFFIYNCAITFKLTMWQKMRLMPGAKAPGSLARRFVGQAFLRRIQIFFCGHSKK